MNEGNNRNIRALRQQVFRDFSPLTPMIYTALDTAHSVVPACIDQFSKSRGDNRPDAGKIHRQLYPHLMRAIMQVLLNSSDLPTRAVEDRHGYDSANPDWERIILSNNGLAGAYAGRNYRILKALRNEPLDKKLPPPGLSEKKRKYYCNYHLQQFRMYLFPAEQGSETPKHNVIYLWDTPTSNSVSLYIACPRWGRGNRASAYFVDAVEHPVLGIVPPEVEDAIPDLNLERLLTDIDIERLLSGDTLDESDEEDDSGEPD